MPKTTDNVYGPRIKEIELQFQKSRVALQEFADKQGKKLEELLKKDPLSRQSALQKHLDEEEQQRSELHRQSIELENQLNALVHQRIEWESEQRRYGGELNAQLKDYVKEKSWKQVIKFCTSSLSNPSQADIYFALSEVIKTGDQTLLEEFFTDTENILTKEAVIFALRHAANGHHRNAVGFLCALKTQIKPNQEDINSILAEAAGWKAWDVVADLCAIMGDNRPNQAAVNDAVVRSVQNGEWKTVAALCAITGDNKPDVKTVEHVLISATEYTGWKYSESDKEWYKFDKLPFLNDLCALEKDNKLSQNAIEGALEIAVRGEQWELVNFFCTLKTDNKPSQDKISDALAQKAKAEETKRIQAEQIQRKWLEDKQEADRKYAADAPRRKEEALRQQAEDAKIEAQYKEEEEANRRYWEELRRKLAEESQRKQKEETQNKQLVATTRAKLDVALATLREKIAKLDQHCSTKAHGAALKLLRELESIKKDYDWDLYKFERKISSKQEFMKASSEFKKNCERKIEEAKPVLKKDLGWGDYLNNLIKSIGNAIIYALTLGSYSSFFSYARPASIIAVEEAEKHLFSV